MAYKFGKDIYSQLTEALSKIDDLIKTICNLETTVKDLSKSLIKKDELIEKQQLEIERLKTKNKKDSSNSSKPSGTDGFKKVITNRREKSDLKQGGQSGHEFYSLNEDKVQRLISKGAEVEIINVNKTDKNKDKRYHTVKVIDIEVKMVVKEYRYYPDESGNYDISVNNIQNIVYGNNIKALSSVLNNAFPNSTDSTTSIISFLTDDEINLSKGTIVNWSEELADKLQPEISNIESELLSSHHLNNDECGVKIDGENYNVINSSNSTHTRQWISRYKKHEDLEAIDFLTKYLGIIVKDGTDIYNGFGTGFSQCNSHILRYTKGIYDFVEHQGPKDMKDFLIRCENERQSLKLKDVNSFDEIRLAELLNEYNTIIKSWKQEWMADKFNPVYDDERKLLSRMEDSDKEQILYFLHDFKIPFTNNRAEADQRPIKIKQKIGKFRSEAGAENYVAIRSCISTYKKNKINVFEALANAFASNPVII